MVKLMQLKALRERKALSQQDLAEQAGLSRVTIARLEAGATEPYPRTVRKLAQVLGVEPEKLMAED